MIKFFCYKKSQFIIYSFFNIHFYFAVEGFSFDLELAVHDEYEQEHWKNEESNQGSDDFDFEQIIPGKQRGNDRNADILGSLAALHGIGMLGTTLGIYLHCPCNLFIEKELVIDVAINSPVQLVKRDYYQIEVGYHSQVAWLVWSEVDSVVNDPSNIQVVRFVYVVKRRQSKQRLYVVQEQVLLGVYPLYKCNFALDDYVFWNPLHHWSPVEVPLVVVQNLVFEREGIVLLGLDDHEYFVLVVVERNSSWLTHHSDICVIKVNKRKELNGNLNKASVFVENI